MLFKLFIVKQDLWAAFSPSLTLCACSSSGKDRDETARCCPLKYWLCMSVCKPLNLDCPHQLVCLPTLFTVQECAIISFLSLLRGLSPLFISPSSPHCSLMYVPIYFRSHQHSTHISLFSLLTITTLSHICPLHLLHSPGCWVAVVCWSCLAIRGTSWCSDQERARSNSIGVHIRLHQWHSGRSKRVHWNCLLEIIGIHETIDPKHTDWDKLWWMQ